MLALEHGGEQAFDLMAERDMEVMPGSRETSGTESQKTTWLEPPVVIRGPNIGRHCKHACRERDRGGAKRQGYWEGQKLGLP